MVRLRLILGRTTLLDLMAFPPEDDDPSASSAGGTPSAEAPPTAEHHARAELGVPFGFQLGALPIDAE